MKFLPVVAEEILIQHYTNVRQINYCIGKDEINRRTHEIGTRTALYEYKQRKLN